MKDKAKPTHTKDGTDKSRSATEGKADEVLRQAEHEYREAVASADELRRRLEKAFEHLTACQKAYRRAKGLPEEMTGDDQDILSELIAEFRAKHDAEKAENKKEEEEEENKAEPTHTEGGTDKGTSAAEKTADEVLSEALHNYREAVASADKLWVRQEEAKAHRNACLIAYRKAQGFPRGR